MEKNDVEPSTLEENESITYATRQMIPQLTQIWIEAFGDEREYVDFYFTNRFCETDMLVYLLDGKPVSMISMLPAYLRVSAIPDNEKVIGMPRQMRYIYAVATLISYRGRGYARKLIKEAYRLLQVPLVLEPATAQLFYYYQRMGFCSAFAVSEYELNVQKEASRIGESVKENQAIQENYFAETNVTMRAAEFIPVTDDASPSEAGMTISLTGASQRYWLLTVTPHEYKKIRDEKLSVAGYVEWDEKAIAYALLENDYCGGYAYKVFHDDMEDILMYRIEDNRMRIIETTLSDADIHGVLAKLRIAPDAVTVRRPVTMHSNCMHGNSEPDSGKSRAFGMILGESDLQNGYLNLTLE